MILCYVIPLLFWLLSFVCVFCFVCVLLMLLCCWLCVSAMSCVVIVVGCLCFVFVGVFVACVAC